jgi:hypothetical protein
MLQRLSAAFLSREWNEQDTHPLMFRLRRSYTAGKELPSAV